MISLNLPKIFHHTSTEIAFVIRCLSYDLWERGIPITEFGCRGNPTDDSPSCMFDLKHLNHQKFTFHSFFCQETM